MKRKIYLMIIIPLILLSVIKIDAQQWVKMNPQFDPPGDYNLGNGIMLDKNNGWVVEELSKKAFQTTDGGLTWKVRLEVDNGTSGDIFFLNNTIGWITFAAGDSTVLFKTEDGGITWGRFVVPFMYRVFFVNETTGFGGGKLNFYKTIDGGASWSKVNLGDKKYYFTIGDSFIFDQMTFFVSSSVWDGETFEARYTFAILKTTDGGNNWFQMETNLDNQIWILPRNIFFTDSQPSVITTWPGSRVYYTVDGGSNWTQTQSLPLMPTGVEINDIFMLNNGKGWIAAQTGNFLTTTDHGISWQRVEGLTDNRLYSISFLKDKSTGFIFGSHNTILKYDNIVGIEEETKTHHSDLSLLQNYPNPFNPTTTFTFELPWYAYTELKVYDLLGKEIKVIEKGFMNKGEHKVLLNAQTLASGIYFCILTQGNYFSKIKLVLIK